MDAAIRRAVVLALDRPGTRWLLSAGVMLNAALRHREPCLVRYRRGAWIRRYRRETLVDRSPGGAGPARVRAKTRDVYLHTCAPRPGDTVIDVGAGIGDTTLAFAGLVGPSGSVLAVEAHPRTFSCLRETCLRNRLDQVVAVHAAVADRCGTTRLSDGEHPQSDTILSPGRDALTVPGETLDSLLDRHGVGEVDLLKLNIEGAEGLALAGMERTLARTRHVVVACHDYRAPTTPAMRTRSRVRAFLEGRGFTIVTRDSDPRPAVRHMVYGVAATA